MMTSDEGARKTAQAYAEKLNKGGRLTSSPKGDRNNCGENFIFYGHTYNLMVTDHAVNEWYD